MSSDDGGNLGCSSVGIEPEIGPEIAETAADEKEKLNLGDDRREEEPEEINTDKAAATVSSAGESGKRIDHIEEDNDGFKTPTYSEHRIPPITECPPAPRKPRPQPSSNSKRKADSSPGVRRSLQFDNSPEVESIFRPIEDNSEEPKVKKARRNDDEESS